MNIITFLFGDPQAQQAAKTAQFKVAEAKYLAAKTRGDRAGMAQWMAEMRRINAQGAAIAQKHLNNVAQMNATANILKAEGQAVAGAFNGASGTIKWAAAAVIAFAVWRTLVIGKKAGRSLKGKVGAAASAVRAKVGR